MPDGEKVYHEIIGRCPYLTKESFNAIAIANRIGNAAVLRAGGEETQYSDIHTYDDKSSNAEASDCNDEATNPAENSIQTATTPDANNSKPNGAELRKQGGRTEGQTVTSNQPAVLGGSTKRPSPFTANCTREKRLAVAKGGMLQPIATSSCNGTQQKKAEGSVRALAKDVNSTLLYVSFNLINKDGEDLDVETVDGEIAVETGATWM